ncbi:MAG: AI-2E family transporter [Ruminiclostridium sp.]|nr:AI-2E family transporter [Ruminiclostridium sp.]
MEMLTELLKKDMTKKILALIAVGFMLYLLKDLMNLLLLTFLFIYLMYSIQKFIQRTIERIVPFKVEKVILTLILYIILISTLAYIVYRYIPVAINQVVSIFNEIALIVTSQRGKVYGNIILDYLVSLLNNMDFGSYLQGKSSYLFQLAGNIGEWGLYLFMSILLSLFFILEKDRVMRFASGFRDSKISGFFNIMQQFGSRLLNSFGKVIQAQILIALCNSVLSVIALWFLGFHQLLGLGLMIFVLSLIPVAGVIISFIPLSIIAFRMGGFIEIVYVIIMILALHAIESYILNPKLYSVKTELPVFFTFLILILSEHFMGVWGLIIGIPIFIFILDLLEFKHYDKKNLT